MNKFNIIGLVILGLLAMGWLVGTCKQYRGEAYVLAKELKAGGLPLEDIKPGEVDSGYQQVTAKGPDLSVMIIRFGSGGIYNQWLKMIKKSGSRMKAPKEMGEEPAEGKRMKIYSKRPILIFAQWPEDKEKLEQELDNALADFEKTETGSAN